MADRDNSQDSKEAGVSESQTNSQTDDAEEVRNATESADSTNENAEHAVRALGNHGEEEEQESGNDPQQVAEEEESKSQGYMILINCFGAKILVTLFILFSVCGMNYSSM